MDRVTMRPWWLAFTLTSAIAGSFSIAAPQEPTIHDLTSTDFSEEQLVEALKPTSDPPPELMTRGLGLAPPKAKCTLYRATATRGLGLASKPPEAIVAISILFAFNSAQLQPQASLEKLGRALASPSLATSCFRIEGHTDSIGSEAANNKLSQMRAKAVVGYLTTHFGLDPERLMPVGFGKRNPIADNRSEEGRLKNRRVQVARLGYGQAEP